MDWSWLATRRLIRTNFQGHCRVVWCPKIIARQFAHSPISFCFLHFSRPFVMCVRKYVFIPRPTFRISTKAPHLWFLCGIIGGKCSYLSTSRIFTHSPTSPPLLRLLLTTNHRIDPDISSSSSLVAWQTFRVVRANPKPTRDRTHAKSIIITHWPANDEMKPADTRCTLQCIGTNAKNNFSLKKGEGAGERDPTKVQFYAVNHRRGSSSQVQVPVIEVPPRTAYIWMQPFRLWAVQGLFHLRPAQCTS